MHLPEMFLVPACYMLCGKTTQKRFECDASLKLFLQENALVSYGIQDAPL